jgi:hypothetical protein
MNVPHVPTHAEFLHAKLSAELKHTAYCSFEDFKPTCFDVLNANTWETLLGVPIPGEVVHDAAFSFINYVDKRHGKLAKRPTNTKRIYECCNRDCQWEVTFTSKTNACDPWFVKDIPPKHSPFCHVENRVQSSKVLRNLPELSTYLMGVPNGNTISRGDIRAHLLSHGWITEHIPDPSWYTTIADIRRQIRKMNADQYTKLSRWLRVFQTNNPASTVILQDDDHGCFHRMFISIPNGPEIFEKSCQPALYCDGCHSQTEEYDGSIISLCALNGNSKVYPLVIACVPGEVTSHMGWFVQMCFLAGYNMEDVPIFTDRGNLLAASRALFDECGITLSLKYCLEHIMRNLVKTFSLSKENETHYRSIVENIQGARYLSELTLNFDKLSKSFSDQKGLHMAVYLLGIHPRHWIVYANKDICDDDELTEWRSNLLRHYLALIEDVDPECVDQTVLLSFLTSSVPIGRKFPLLGRNRNNPCESENSSGGVKKNSNSDTSYRGKQPSFLVQSWLERWRLIVADQTCEFAKLMLVPVEDGGEPFTLVGARLLTKMVSETTLFKYDGKTTEDGVVYHYIVHCDNKTDERYKVLVCGNDSYCHCTPWLMHRFYART